MIRAIFLKTIKFFCRLLSKITYFCVPFFSRILIMLRLHSRVINQLNKLRAESHKSDDHSSLILKFLGNEKLITLDAGAQGGFYNAGIFSKRYNKFFEPILVEPIQSEAQKLIDQNYKVVPNALWSTNCNKKLFVDSLLSIKKHQRHLIDSQFLWGIQDSQISGYSQLYFLLSLLIPVSN